MRALIGCMVSLACLTGCVSTPNTSQTTMTAPRSLNEVAPEALFEHGRRLAASGDHVAAEQYLTAALKRGYAEERCVAELVRVSILGGRLDSALSHALPYLERHPEDFRVRHAVASVQLASGNPREARLELTRVLELAPTLAEAQFLMGIVLRDEFGEPAAARRHFSNYLALAPSGEHASEARFWVEHATYPSAPVPQGEVQP